MPTARPQKKTAATEELARGEDSAKATPVPAAQRSAKKKSAGDPTNPQRVETILHRLAEHYPNAVCALHHRNAWELMVATILSAQCTDVRVNMVTPALFKRFPTPQAMAKASQAEVEEMIRTTGFFRNKAKNIIGAAQMVVAEFGGKVPQTMEELLTIPGVARKTANVVSGSWYKIPLGVVVDTHVMRITQRLELTKSTTPEKIEQDYDAVDSAASLDRLFPSRDSFWPGNLHRAETSLRRLFPGRPLQLQRQDVEHALTIRG